MPRRRFDWLMKTLICKLLFFAVLIAALAAASTLRAQMFMEDESRKLMAAYAKEPPLTQADIEAYVNYLTLLALDPAPERIPEICEEIGLSEIRLTLIGTKLDLALILAEQPEVFRPTDEDMKLLGDNIEALEAGRLALNLSALRRAAE